ncbi:MAG: hypothetical protein HYZ53_05205 [Planctomycetes bacterium]|nr:hypothetical protein [Planctomycetota bacterium]
MLSRSRPSVLFGLLALLSPALAFAWGETGHELVNGGAIGLLPPDLRPFFERHRAELVRLANEPDRRKKIDKAEPPRHFLDMDIGGSPGEYPRKFADAQRRFGAKAAQDQGTVPWTIEAMTAELAAAMTAGDEASIVDVAGRLGHYVGDSFVPLHTTSNYDGQLTGNRGIHKRWEAEMLELFPFDAEMQPWMSPAAEVEDPLAFAFDTLLASHAEVRNILDADTELKPLRGTPEYFAKLKEKVGALAARRLGQASTGTASLWYTAWVKAGKPALPEPAAKRGE